MSDKWLDLSDKIVIVTGGSMGIGEAMVTDLKGNGAKVVIADFVEPKDYVEDEQTLYVKCDITKKDQVEHVVSETMKKFGQLDALVNNAGVTRPRVLVDYFEKEEKYELDEEDFDFMVNVNQRGTFLFAQAAARIMYKQQSGVIINMSSEAGIQGSRAHSAYSGTKAAIHAYGLSWAKELGPYNVRVVGVEPAILDRTPANNDEKYRAQAYGRGQDPNKFYGDYTKSIPLGRPGHLSEVADLICFLVSDHASYITGTTIAITGGKSQ